MVYINVAKDFSKTPFGRFNSDGPNNGERFRKEKLLPVFENTQNEPVLIDFDGISLIVGSSFFEEAFGGLIRANHINKNNILSRLEIKSKTPIYEMQIKKFISEAQPK